MACLGNGPRLYAACSNGLEQWLEDLRWVWNSEGFAITIHEFIINEETCRLAIPEAIWQCDLNERRHGVGSYC